MLLWSLSTPVAALSMASTPRRQMAAGRLMWWMIADCASNRRRDGTNRCYTSQYCKQPHLAQLKARVSLLGWLTGTTPLLTAICSPIGRSLLLLSVKVSSPATAAGLALKGVGPFETPACSIAASAITEALLLIEATTLLPLRAPGAIAILGRLLVLLHIPCRGLPLLLRGGPALWLGRQGRLGQQLRLVFSSHGHRASTSISRGCRVHCLSQ